MPLHYIKKDITTVEGPAISMIRKKYKPMPAPYVPKTNTIAKGPAIIMHGVNCRGKMGSGVAKALYEKWPIVKEEYLSLPKEERVLGNIQCVQVANNILVFNCFTQETFGKDGKKYASPHAILECLVNVSNYVGAIYESPSAFYSPKIGCGLGGLDWETEVRPIFEYVAKKYPERNIFICEPPTEQRP